ncbi:hypothetical protein ZWY2020_009851 [Hordeum vulgare]|nr:hypothetical protein ZWY2020_009851 [Hordeum vulgare]
MLQSGLCHERSRQSALWRAHLHAINSPSVMFVTAGPPARPSGPLRGEAWSGTVAAERDARFRGDRRGERSKLLGGARPDARACRSAWSDRAAARPAPRRCSGTGGACGRDHETARAAAPVRVSQSRGRPAMASSGSGSGGSIGRRGCFTRRL